MDILKLAQKSGPEVYYNKDFMDVLEAHLDYLKKDSSTHIVQVKADRVAIYEGDFYGYLNEVGIEPEYHWIIMRINGMRSPTEFTNGMDTLFIPSKDEINQIRMAHNATGVVKI